MANSILTPTQVTRAALAILHEKLTFIGTINRQYDSSFAKSGAKIGDSLKIRLPNRYTVRTGKALDAQDTSETSTTLTVATQKGVDLNFSSAERTMELDDFSQRILEPAMAALASDIEYTVLSGVTKDIYSVVGTAGTTPASFQVATDARARLNQQLAPKDSERFIQMDSVATGTVVNALKGLFHDSKEVAKQYRDGYMGMAGGFKWHENDRTYVHSNPDDVTTVAVDEPSGTNLVNGTSTLHLDGLGTTFPAGTVFTIAGVNAVHPETKQSYGRLQQFVVTSDPTIASNEGDVSISPAIYSSGANQNVDSLPSDNDAITVVGSASTDYEQHLAYHKDAFTFATADLVMPSGVDFAAQEVFDGISMRVVRAYDINNDNFPCRLDVLFGYKTLRPEFATRITG